MDDKNNAATVRARFKPSTRQDTTPPSLALSPIDTLTTFPFRIIMDLNEPADTSRGLNILSVPHSASTLYRWRQNLSHMEVIAPDTVLKRHPFYLVILPGLSDFSGNRLKQGFSTYIYADTLSALTRIAGSAGTEEYATSGCMLITFKVGERIMAATLADSTHHFAIYLERPDSVKVEAWFDYERDGLFDEGGSNYYAILPDSIELTTRRLSAPLSLKQIVPGSP